MTTNGSDINVSPSSDDSPAPQNAPSPPSDDPGAASASPAEGAAAAANEQPGDAPAAPSDDAATNQPSSAANKIQIGSRRGKEGPRSSRPKVAGADKSIKAEPAKKPPMPPTPSRRDPLTPDLEREIDDALADISLDSALMGGQNADLGALLEEESRHSATVARVRGDDVFLSLGNRNEGVASVRQFKEPPEPGETFDIVVRGYNVEDGLYELSIPGAAIDVGDWSDLVEGAVVEARVTGANTGGLECQVNAIRGFIPASQVALYRIENFAEFVDQKLPCIVTEADAQRRNLVLSHRAVLEREREESRQRLLEELEVGQSREGVVRGLRDFGAFVDLGGIDGLIHISQLSWDRVKHPSEVLAEGDKVKVRVEKVDRQTGKIGLSYRDLLDNPWDSAEGRFPVGALVSGVVTRTAEFGAFVKLAPGIEGLVHISEIAHKRVHSVGAVLSEGQEVQVKVLSIDSEAQRISLSMKASLAAAAEADAAESEESPADENQAPSALPARKRSTPLKGGMDRPSGGSDFGINW